MREPAGQGADALEELLLDTDFRRDPERVASTLDEAR